MEVTGVVLAGGKSSRMGSNKALLFFEGKRLIERTIETLHEVVVNVIVVANDKQSYDFLHVPIVPDKVQDKGPLGGLQAGLEAAPTNAVLLVACDMPFLSPAVIHYILDNSHGYDAVVPRINGKLHPLFALYKQSALPIIEECLGKDELRMVYLLSKLAVNYIDEKELEKNVSENMERVFFNMNYREDYEKVTT